MLDQLRRDIQARLDQLLAEADRLRRALAALSPRDGSKTETPSDSEPAPVRASSRSTPAARRRTTTPQSGDRGSQPAPSAGKDQTATAPARTAPGATKTAVLSALASGKAMTASEVSSATGLGRASVSTTLSKLAKTGEITKASRGYRIADEASRATVTGEHEDEQAAV
jgi:DNA-binding transcriptional ArsR family regulator